MCWCPPSRLPFKANFDGALSSENNMTGVGVIIQDGHGLPIASMCKHFQCLHTVDDAEAIAAREAVQLAIDVGLSEVEVEGDFVVICKPL